MVALVNTDITEKQKQKHQTKKPPKTNPYFLLYLLLNKNKKDVIFLWLMNVFSPHPSNLYPTCALSQCYCLNIKAAEMLSRDSFEILLSLSYRNESIWKYLYLPNMAKIIQEYFCQYDFIINLFLAINFCIYWQQITNTQTHKNHKRN